MSWHCIQQHAITEDNMKMVYFDSVWCNNMPLYGRKSMGIQYSLVQPVSMCMQIVYATKYSLVNMDLYKNLVPKNSRNNHIIECTKAENASLASKDWIGKLDVPYWCHEFHSQFLKCHYISKPSNEELATIKAYFKDYWSFLERWRLYCKVDKCWRNWHMLWLPFYLSSTWNSQIAEFKFLVGEINYFLNEPWIYNQYIFT